MGKPDAIRAISAAIDEELRYMRERPSLASVLAVVETLALAAEMGHRAVRPTQHQHAMREAQRAALALDATALRDGAALRRSQSRKGPDSSKMAS